jgi:hypothetical protein
MEQIPSWEANRFLAGQEVHCILWNLKVYYHIDKSPPTFPILDQISLLHALPSHFLKIHLSIIFPCTKSHVHFPSLSLYQRSRPSPRKMILFCNKTSFYGELLAPCPTPQLEHNLCWLSATAYFIYILLPSILEAIPPSATLGTSCRGDWDPIVMVSQWIYFLNLLRRDARSPFSSPKNSMYFIMLSFVVHKVFTF